MTVVLEGAKMPVGFVRQNPIPLDKSSVFASKDILFEYAANSNEDVKVDYCPYVGQVVSDSSTGNLYVLKTDPEGDDDGRGHFIPKLVGTMDNVPGLDTDNTFTGAITFKNLVTFLGNIVFGTNSGLGITVADGKATLTISNLNVLQKATFNSIDVSQVQHTAGTFINSHASMTIYKVDASNPWKIYLNTTDSDGKTVYHQFAVNDLALCQTYNVTKSADGVSGNRYYWRKVTEVGTDYIVLSSTGEGTTEPAVGDYVVQLGNTETANRQGAQIMGYDETNGAYLAVVDGINSCTFPSYTNAKIYLSPKTNKITGTFISETNGFNYDEKITDITSDLDTAKTDITTVKSGLGTLGATVADIKSQTDKQLVFWFGTADPTTSNAPASDWTTSDLKSEHLYDTYYNKSSGKAWDWEYIDNAYVWNPITDSDTIRALEKAATAQDTADGKRRTFVETQPTPPYDKGDLWVNATYGSTYKNDILRCGTSKASGQNFSISDWGLAQTNGTNQVESKFTQQSDSISAVVTRVGNAENSITAIKDLTDTTSSLYKYISGSSSGAVKDAADNITTIKNNLISGLGATDFAGIVTKLNSITTAVNNINFVDGKITNISTSGLVTTADFNTLLSQKVTIENGNVTNISKSGLWTTSDGSTLSATYIDSNGTSHTASLSVVTKDTNGVIQSGVSLKADQVIFKTGTFAINNGTVDTFKVDSDGNVTMNGITATNGNFSGVVNATSGSFTGVVNATSGTFTGTVNATSGSFTGEVIAKSGQIGYFHILDNKLYCYTTDTAPEGSIIRPSLEIGTVGNDQFLVNKQTSVAICEIDAYYRTGLSIVPYNTEVGLAVTANTSGTAMLISGTSYIWANESGQIVSIHGLSLKNRDVSASGDITTCDDIIFVTSNSSLTLTLPAASNNGKVITIVKMYNNTVTVNGSLWYDGSAKSSTSWGNRKPMILRSNGSYWFVGFEYTTP